MKFEIIGFQHSSQQRIPAMRLFFKFNFFERLFGKSNYSSLFTYEGYSWFETFDNGKQFKCDDVTDKFIQSLYDEVISQSKSLKMPKNGLKIVR